MLRVGLEISVILLLVVLNGLLSMSEMAVVSSRRLRLRQMAEDGHRGAARALELAEKPGLFLSTIQVGITLVGIVSGAFGGATLSKVFSAALQALGASPRVADGISFSVIVLAITLLSVVLGELVPKRLALNRPEAIAAAAAGPMQGLARGVGPLVKLLSSATDAVLGALRLKPPSAPPVTEDELRALIREGQEAGVFEKVEEEMVGRVLSLADQPVSAIMTPASDVVLLDLASPPEENRKKIAAGRHFDYPVYEGSPDKIVGIASVRDLLPRALSGEPFVLRSSLVPPLFIPETTSALGALRSFREARLQIAVVVDEFGGLAGVVTPIDVLKAVAGELASGPEEEPAVVRRADGSLLVDGKLAADRLGELLGLSDPLGEPGEFQTAGGFAMKRLGRLPHEGNRFEFRGFSFEVVDMDGRRVDKLLVSRL